MHYRFKTSLMLWLAAVATLTFACADGAQNLPAGGDDMSFPDATGRPDIEDTSRPDGVVLESDRLVLETDSPLKIVRNGDGKFRVRFETAEGLPIPGALLGVSILGSTPDECHLDEVPCIQVINSQAETGDDGVGEFAVHARSKDADIEFEFSVTGAESIDPVQATLQIRDKDSYDLIVDFVYEGNRQFRIVQPKLYTTEASSTDPNPPQDCAGVYSNPNPRNVGEFHPSEAGVPHTELTRNPDGSIPSANYLSLKTTQRYIAAGFARSADGSETITVYGCSDEVPDETLGAPRMTVTMVEVPKLVAGDYSITSNFDLLSALPETDVVDPGFGDLEVGDWVRLVINLFDNPGGTLIDLVDMVFDIPDGTLSLVAESLLNQAIEQFAPDWLLDTLTVGADIGNILTDFQLEGTLKILQEPEDCGDERGAICLPAGQIHEYHAVTFSWGLGLPMSGEFANSCGPAAEGGGKVTCALFDPNQGAATLITGEWSGTFDPANGQLAIDPHGIVVPYGRIFLLVVEQLVLPSIFGPTVTSISGMIGHLVTNAFIDFYNNDYCGDQGQSDGCCAGGNPPPNCVYPTADPCEGGSEAIARLILDDPGFVQDIVQVLCEAGLSTIQSEVNQFADSLTLDTGAALVFDVPTEAACPVRDTDSDLQYDALGSNDAQENRCSWGIQLTINNYMEDVVGRFHGNLK